METYPRTGNTIRNEGTLEKKGHTAKNKIVGDI